MEERIVEAINGVESTISRVVGNQPEFFEEMEKQLTNANRFLCEIGDQLDTLPRDRKLTRAAEVEALARDCFVAMVHNWDNKYKCATEAFHAAEEFFQHMDDERYRKEANKCE